jgi:hypothetical protein
MVENSKRLNRNGFEAKEISGTTLRMVIMISKVAVIEDRDAVTW